MKSIKKYDIMKSRQTDHIMNEIKILGMIDHPFIITFDGFAQDEKFIFLSLELINGGELFTYLRTIGKFAVEQAQYLFFIIYQEILKNLLLFLTNVPKIYVY